MLFIMIFVQSDLYFPSYSGVTCHHTLIQLLNQNLTENAIVSTVTQHNQTHIRDSFIQNPNHKTCSKCLAVSSFITANRQLYMTAILYLHNDSTTHTDSQKWLGLLAKIYWCLQHQTCYISVTRLQLLITCWTGCAYTDTSGWYICKLDQPLGFANWSQRRQADSSWILAATFMH